VNRTPMQKLKLRKIMLKENIVQR